MDVPDSKDLMSELMVVTAISSTASRPFLRVSFELICAFKKAWAQFSDPNIGLLEPPNLVPLLAKLSGIFEYSTVSILVACQDKSKKDNKTGGVHMHKLNKLKPQQDQFCGDPKMMGGVYAYSPQGEHDVLSRQGDLIYGHACATCTPQVEQQSRGAEVTGWLVELEVREEAPGWWCPAGLDKVWSQLRMSSLHREFLQECEALVVA
ncbi:hypothetical protein HD554DRAFT_2040151 [Boletus coccyginus]|nr:hypothetical protein HD554DRAFT_2040151 [Boletus coccyginus]